MTIPWPKVQPSLKGEQPPQGLSGRAGFGGCFCGSLERYQPSDDEKAIQNNWTVVSQVRMQSRCRRELPRDEVQNLSEVAGNEFNNPGPGLSPTGAFDSSLASPVSRHDRVSR